MNDDEKLVREAVATLLEDHGQDDQLGFLGAQFDAGLAWVSNRRGEGGLGLRPKLQEVIDDLLELAGRRPNWLRNPVGVGMVAPTIAQVGTEEQRRRVLRRLWTAEDIGCQLFSEPGAGSDVATLATRAERDGDEWVVNGQKVWTSLAARSKWGLLLARTDPDQPKHAGLTAFLIDMHAEGVEIRPIRQINGGSEFSEVYFTDARFPDTDRVGEVGAGWGVAVATLMNERVSIGGAIEPRGSGPIGVAVRAWRQFGHDDPARLDGLMSLWVEAEVLRLGNLRAQQLREAGTPGPEGSVLKLGHALLGQRALSFAVDLHGPAGMLWGGGTGGNGGDRRDQAVTAFLGAQSNTIAGGTSEIMRNILGERVLGLPSEPRADKNVPWSQIPK